MTKSEAVSLVTLATAAYPTAQGKDPEPIATAWKIMLGDMPYTIAKAAVIRVCRTSRYFPSVAEIVETAREIDPRCEHPPTPAEAWEEVMQLMRKAGPTFVPVYSCDLVKRAVRAIGWHNLCLGENPEASRAHFLKLYEAMRNKQQEGWENEQALVLSGRFELVKTIAGRMGVN